MYNNFSFNNILEWFGGIWGLATVIFWSATYVFIVIAGFLSQKEKKVSMPYVSGVLNVAWEIAAICYTEGNPGFILWLAIDFFIVCFGFIFLPHTKKILYCISIAFSVAVFLFCFTKFTDGFLFTVYLIDAIMEIDYLINYKRLSQKFMLAIATTKLLGDFSAGLTFGHLHSFIWFFAAISFACNLAYLIKCVKNSRGGKTN